MHAISQPQPKRYAWMPELQAIRVFRAASQAKQNIRKFEVMCGHTTYRGVHAAPANGDKRRLEHYPRHFGSNQGLSAWRCLPIVIAGFQGDVGC